MIAVASGLTHFGDGEEAPPRAVEVAPFFLDREPVSVARFAAFAREHGWVTRAETVGEGAVMDLSTGDWRLVEGATFQQPLGPTQPRAEDDHPVTQVAYPDAVAYCESRGGRLPTEEEWEHAARNARDDRARTPWGDEALAARANVWQGSFPTANTLEDGFLFTSPIGSFPATPLGLRDLVGNVWQWTSSAFDPRTPATRAIRGGSFLCDDDVCHGARLGARQSARDDESFFHLGFRCARDEVR